MQHRTLGSTGLRVSAVGIGTWGLGGDLWRDLDAAEGQRALICAIESGVNLVDTALIYGYGQSEQLVGSAIRDMGVRDECVVASKVPPKNARWPADPAVPLDQVFPADYVQRSVEDSLRNLKAEVIGVEQLHVWRDEWLDSSYWPELRATMQRMIREGKVLHWGISVNDHQPDSALRILEDPLIESVQVIYNIFDRSAEAALLERATEHEVGVLARCPFDEGALVGAITAESQFHPDDFRSRYFRGNRKAQAAERADRLRPLLGDEASSLAELALRFCLSRSEVSSVIPGMRRPDHVRSNVAVGDGRALSAALLERLADHAWDKNWYANE